MRSKYRIQLNHNEYNPIYGTISVSITVSQQMKDVLAIKGYGEVEINNMINQKFQEVIDLIGVEE